MAQVNGKSEKKDYRPKKKEGRGCGKKSEARRREVGYRSRSITVFSDTVNVRAKQRGKADNKVL